MRRGAAAMAALVLTGLMFAIPVGAAEGDGSPPLVVIPVPDPVAPSTIPAPQQTQPVPPTLESVPGTDDTGPAPELSEEAEGVVEGPYMRPWLLLLVAVMLFGGFVAVTIRRRSTPAVTAASRSESPGLVDGGERWAISAAAAPRTGLAPRYELVGFVFDDGADGEFGLSVLTQGRYVDLDEAVAAAQQEQEGDASKAHVERIWWVVASIDDGATISVIRPTNGIENGTRVSRLERLIDDLVERQREE